jgi:hypothetical protein
LKGLSSAGRARIEALIGKMFDGIAYDLLGYIPGPGKKITFSTRKPSYTLLHLFLESLGNRVPTDGEKDYAKSLVQNAANYVTSLRDKTKAGLIEAVDAYIQQEEGAGRKASRAMINDIIAKEMEKAKSHVKMIAEAESTKVRNGAVAADIERVGKSLSIQDPSVYFVVIKDGKTCQYCLRNHFMDDRVTPKVLKLSEVKKTYLTTQERKDGMCSIAGQHPHCRCSMVFLAPGFGFEAGRMKWVGYGHDEHSRQKLGS